MILHRSISILELRELLNNKLVKGRYNIKSERQSTAKVKELVISTFADDVWWIDKRHDILLILDIPEDRLTLGIGDYWASADFVKTHIWSGRRGLTHYYLKEAYTPYYTIDDIKAIGLNKEAQFYYDKTLKNNGIKTYTNIEIENITRNRLKNTTELIVDRVSKNITKMPVGVNEKEQLAILKQSLGAVYDGKNRSILKLKHGNYEYKFRIWFGSNTTNKYFKTVEMQINGESIIKTFMLTENVISEIKNVIKSFN